MPILEIDLTTADVLPDGVYVATIQKVDVKPSAAGDNTLVNFQLQVNSPAQFAGRIFYNNTNFKSAYRIKMMMDAAKCVYTSTGANVDLTIGKQINVQVGTKDSTDFGPQNTVIKAWAI